MASSIMFSSLTEMLNNPIVMVDDTIIAESVPVDAPVAKSKRAWKRVKAVEPVPEVVVPEDAPVEVVAPIAPKKTAKPAKPAKASPTFTSAVAVGEIGTDIEELRKEVLYLRIFKAKIDAQNEAKKARAKGRDVAKKAGTFVSKNKSKASLDEEAIRRIAREEHSKLNKIVDKPQEECVDSDASDDEFEGEGCPEYGTKA